MAAMSSVPLSHLDAEDVMRLFSKATTNTLTIEPGGGNHVGIGVYPFTSMANHSDSCAAPI